MTLATWFRAAALMCAAATATQAHAQPIDADGAQQLEQQIRGWLATMLGPTVDPGQRPIHVDALADRYRLSVPIAGPVGDTGFVITANPITAEVRPAEGTTWTILGFAYPSPLDIRNTKPKKDAPRAFGLTFGAQTASGTLDTSFATTSTMDMQVSDYTTAIEGEHTLGTTHIDRMVTHTVWQPAADGRLDMSATLEAGKLSNSMAQADGKRSTLTIGKQSSNSRMTGVLPSAVPDLIHAVALLVPIMQAVPPGEKMKSLPEDARPPARAIVTSLRDLFSTFESAFSLDNIAIDGEKLSATLAHAGIGTGFASTDGKLSTTISLALDGIDSPQIPKGPWRDYLPRHIAYRQRLSGLPAQGAYDLAMHAIDSDGTGTENDALEAEALQLIAAGPLVFGIDELSLDLGPATLAATGTVQTAGPAAATGHAEVQMTGLDELLKRVNTTPQLRQATPFLIFLKGIGKQVGGRTVWDIDYDQHSFTVNGTDVSNLVPKPGK